MRSLWMLLIGAAFLSACSSYTERTAPCGPASEVLGFAGDCGDLQPINAFR